jgi:hypothetical protein
MNFDDDIPPDDPAAERPMARAEENEDAATARHLAVLEGLRDMGLDVAKALKTRVILAAAEGKTDDKAAKSFALVATTVQQVILLHLEVAGLREKRRESRLAQRKARVKQIVRRAIDPVDVPGAIAPSPRIEKERQVRRVRLDDLFHELDDDIFEGLSVAEVVERACKLFGVTPDPTLNWPEWAELRGQSPPEPSSEPPAQSPRIQSANAPSANARPVIPARLSGASPLGLNGRAPPMPPFAGPRERAPP